MAAIEAQAPLFGMSKGKNGVRDVSRNCMIGHRQQRKSAGREMAMPKPGETVTKSRHVKVLIRYGMPRIDVTRQIGVGEKTCHRWKVEYNARGIEQLTN